jgi:dethiobiotin synthetase/adenosylmethionine--8-amino-7-oxononanoate aminotransferase
MLGLSVVETAGGVTSPGPSGHLQVTPADVAAAVKTGCTDTQQGGVSDVWETPTHLPDPYACTSAAAQPYPSILARTHECLTQCATQTTCHTQHTPITQGDIYRPLALPALLVGDPALGGISTTLSAYESLLLRGAAVPAVIMMTEGRYNNVAAVRQHLQHAAAHRCAYVVRAAVASANARITAPLPFSSATHRSPCCF